MTKFSEEGRPEPDPDLSDLYGGFHDNLFRKGNVIIIISAIAAFGLIMFILFGIPVLFG